MPRKCLLCSADEELRSGIEQFVNKGNSYVDAARYAKERGLDISHTSIQRHIENHTQIEYTTENDFGLQMDVVANPVEFENWDGLETRVNSELREILGNLTVLCNSKLKAYMKGEAKFPRDEFRTLHGTYAMLNKRGEVFNAVTADGSDKESKCI